MANTANVFKLSAAKQARIIDELGALKVQIAALKAQFDDKIAVFKDFGDGEYVGKVYKVNVNTAEKAALDNKIVKALLTPAQLVEATKYSSVTTAAVKAR